MDQGIQTPFLARPAARHAKDRITTWAMTLGGVGVIVAITLIFFYLLWVVLPLFGGAHAEAGVSYDTPGDAGDARIISTDELARVGVVYDAAGGISFFETADGSLRKRIELAPEGSAVTSISSVSAEEGLVVTGLDDGRAILSRHGFQVSYPDGVRTVAAELRYPLGEGPITVDPLGRALSLVTGRAAEDGALIAAMTVDGRIRVTEIQVSENFLTGERTLGEGASSDVELEGLVQERPTHLLLDPLMQWLFVVAPGGETLLLDTSDPSEVRLIERRDLLAGSTRVTDVEFLLGGYSLLIGTDDGRIIQVFPVRGERGYGIEEVREQSFSSGSPVRDIVSEQRRKGFVALAEDGTLGVFFSTSNRRVLEIDTGLAEPEVLGISPRAQMLLAVGDGGISTWALENEHPEVSWSSIWSRVWYESFQEPKFIWQSSAANNDFEPKFSLVPLAFGTLKAAFYAMLFAIPLAIMGAIYTAYFMTPSMRKLVKPTIEIMEALPTVILGFLAGLWLAPFVEANLFGVFLVILLLPISVLMFGWLWQRAPTALRHAVPDGWDAALLVPVIAFTIWLALVVGAPVEVWLFGGSLPQWFTTELGVSFDQRNALVVGVAMGFAVIPTIFSIAEDALFGVPKHLSYGSLALGATPWQTVVRVVLPTASPGIFSAVMIGLGRAVGETMIVLMATGNTPVMDFSIFEGMRTLSANIAVEMPESEVNSTHYRLLFLAGLVLFMFTFVVNTGAELVRQRLRKKYATL